MENISDALCVSVLTDWLLTSRCDELVENTSMSVVLRMTDDCAVSYPLDVSGMTVKFDVVGAVTDSGDVNVSVDVIAQCVDVAEDIEDILFSRIVVAFEVIFTCSAAAVVVELDNVRITLYSCLVLESAVITSLCLELYSMVPDGISILMEDIVDCGSGEVISPVAIYPDDVTTDGVVDCKLRVLYATGQTVIEFDEPIRGMFVVVDCE